MRGERVSTATKKIHSFLNMRIERLFFQIFLLVDKTRQIEQTKLTGSTTGSETGSENENSLNRPEVRRLVNKWKWSQPSYQGEYFLQNES